MPAKPSGDRFEIEQKLKQNLNIPIFHDDQHGTAVVVLAALLNVLKVVNKKLEEVKLVLNGAGSAGKAITKLLLKAGLNIAVLVDRFGIVCEGETWMNPAQAEMAAVTNRGKIKGTLADAIVGADVSIGVSAPGVLTKEMVSAMNPQAVVFAMANPTREIFPEEAKEGGAWVVGTGRSDFPNQVNNVLAFPGIFRGALDVRAKDINYDMKIAAARAIAKFVEHEINVDFILPVA